MITINIFVKTNKYPMNCKCYKNKITVFTNPVIKNVNSYLFELLQVSVMTLVITNNYNKAKLITNIDHTMNYQLIVCQFYMSSSTFSSTFSNILIIKFISIISGTLIISFLNFSSHSLLNVFL